MDALRTEPVTVPPVIGWTVVEGVSQSQLPAQMSSGFANLHVLRPEWESVAELFLE